jgi:hypothetical protein
MATSKCTNLQEEQNMMKVSAVKQNPTVRSNSYSGASHYLFGIGAIIEWLVEEVLLLYDKEEL